MMKRFIPLLLLTASVVNAAPTLKRSWGFAGMTGNSPDTGDNFKIQLEAPGTPRAVAAGDLLVLAVAFHNGLTATITDDKSNTWTSAISCANTGLTTPRKYQIFYAVNAAAGTSLITVGFGGLTTDVQIAVRSYYNTATSSPLDGTICTTRITPVNNIAPNIQPGAISTTIDGDLIDNQIFDEEEGDGSIGANTISGVTYGSGFTGLYGEVFFGAAAQYQVQSTHGSINPGITFSQTTHDSFASLAIAIKAGSGGAAPGSGISIIRSQMAYIVSFSGATVVPFPTSGNLVIVCNDAGTFGSSLTSVTDSNSNTYTVIAGITAGVPELYHADNATTGNNLVVTLHTTTGRGNDLVAMYDVAGAATSPLDTAATAANSSTLTAAGRGATKNSATQLNAGDALADAPSIVPSTANGLVFGSMNIGLGPSSGSSAFTYDYIPATWNSGGGDNNGFGNGDGMSHYFNPNTSTVNFGYTMTNASAATWNALAAAFKAGTGDTTPPTAPSNLTATAAGNTQINLSWTAATETGGTISQYLIERCQGSGCSSFAQVATSNATTYNDTGLLTGTTYSYRVRATDAAGNLSPYSNVSSATIPSTTTTIAYVQGNYATPQAPQSTVSVTYTAAQTTGDLNVVVVGWNDSVATVNTVTDASGNVYVRAVGPTVLSPWLSQSIYYSQNIKAAAAGANSVTITFSTAAVSPDIRILEYSGADLNNPVDITAASSGNSTSDTSGSATTTNPTDLLFAANMVGTYTPGPGSGFTSRLLTSPDGDIAEDRMVTATGSYSATTADLSPAGPWIMQMVAFRTPVGSGVTPTAPTNLTATASGPVQINLSWTAATETGGTISQYLIERCTGATCSNFVQVGTSTTTTFNDTGLTGSTSYSYRVRATDAAGNVSGFSNTATATTQASAQISVSISPQRGGVVMSQTLPLTATVNNDIGGAGVTWTATGGALTGQTPTSATFSSTAAGTFTVTAESNADTTVSASVTIGVTDLSGVTTYHNNLSRDGTNAKEYALTTSNVNTSSFGKLFSCAVDGEVYAQPLWVPSLAIGGGTHNVIFVATQNDSVYAFDADANPCVQYWQKSFLGMGITPVPPADTGEAFDINKKIGITATPVIDAASGTLYVLAKTKETAGTGCSVPAPCYFQRLHAMSLVDGTEKFGGPTAITPAITVPGSGDTGDSSAGCTATPGNVPFCPLRENQRPGLALAGGNVYVSWASHGDYGPYHGWIMSFNASNLAQAPVVFNDSPNGRQGGIWMSGGAPAFDSSNNLYVITGNGDYDGANDFGDSFLKLNSGLVLQDWFTPFVQGTLDSLDLDLGSGGAIVLLDLPFSAVPRILIGGGKGTNALGQVYVVNRDNMGQNANPDKVVQAFDLGGMIYSTAAFWQNTMYIGGVGQALKAFALNTSTSQFNTVATSQSSHRYGFPGTTPVVSSAGTTSGTGIVWALDTNSTTAANASGTDGPTVLYAYDALNLGTVLWDSTQGSGNAAGNAVKFCVPTVANGKVYVGTQTEVDVYGLLSN